MHGRLLATSSGSIPVAAQFSAGYDRRLYRYYSRPGVELCREGRFAAQWQAPSLTLCTMADGGTNRCRTPDRVGPIEAGPPGRVTVTRCTPSVRGRSCRGVPEVGQPAAVRPTSAALTCQSRAATAAS